MSRSPPLRTSGANAGVKVASKPSYGGSGEILWPSKQPAYGKNSSIPRRYRARSV
jgi:hypothetical protein